MPTALKGSPLRHTATLDVATPRKTAATPWTFPAMRAIRRVAYEIRVSGATLAR
jgi:hypothetical protein